MTRRAVGTVRNGDAVGGAHTPETPTLHRTSKALTLRMTGDVDQLPCDEMVSRKLSSDVQQRVISDTEFSNLQLGFNFRFGEVAALRLGDIFWFRSEEHTSELQSLMRISYAVFCLNTKYYIFYTYTS